MLVFGQGIRDVLGRTVFTVSDCSSQTPKWYPGKALTGISSVHNYVKPGINSQPRGATGFTGCMVPKPKQHTFYHCSRGTFPVRSRHLFSGKPPNTLGNSWLLKRTMVEKNGESTPRIVVILSNGIVSDIGGMKLQTTSFLLLSLQTDPTKRVAVKPTPKPVFP